MNLCVGYMLKRDGRAEQKLYETQTDLMKELPKYLPYMEELPEITAWDATDILIILTKKEIVPYIIVE